MKSTLSLLLFATVPAMAGIINGLQLPNDLPGCGTTCINEITSAAQCVGSNKELVDCNCRALSPNDLAENGCIKDKCNAKQGKQVAVAVQKVCSGDNGSGSSRASSSQAAQWPPVSASSASSASSDTATDTAAPSAASSTSGPNQTRSSVIATASSVDSSATQPATRTTAASQATKTTTAAPTSTTNAAGSGPVVGVAAVVLAAAMAL